MNKVLWKMMQESEFDLQINEAPEYSKLNIERIKRLLESDVWGIQVPNTIVERPGQGLDTLGLWK